MEQFLFFFLSSSEDIFIFIASRERKKGREGERKILMWETVTSCLPYAPRPERGWYVIGPRMEPSAKECALIGNEPATFWLRDKAPTNWVTPARAEAIFLLHDWGHNFEYQLIYGDTLKAYSRFSDHYVFTNYWNRFSIFPSHPLIPVMLP